MGIFTHFSLFAWIAQLVERAPEEGEVPGSSPGPSTSMMTFQNILAWADRNERHLGAVLFVLGFGTDLYTFGTLEIQVVNWLFVGYVGITAASTLVSHYLYSHEKQEESFRRKAAKVSFTLLAQYTIGSLLSGILIFYGKSATVLVSWPFLLMLLAIFIGNEFFRKYKERLTFQTAQFFFTLYAYILFALPLSLHTLGRSTFLISSLVSTGIFALFLIVLYAVGKERFMESFWQILISTLVLLCAMIGSYFTGILPPLPLTLKDSGIYHDIRHIGDTYIVSAEQKEKWYSAYLHTTIHITAGEPLYGFSSVFAPGAFNTSISHVWERYDSKNKKWIPVSQVSFLLSGGRNGGYRGYSEITSPDEGVWRLSVRTESGQVIGRVDFTIVYVSTSTPSTTLSK